jgi:hypothetical protein
MISQRAVAIYGWITLGILVFLLIVVWTDMAGPEMERPILIIAGILFLSRVILRFLSRRRPSNDSDEGR